MIKDLTLFRPSRARRSKLFIPENILIQMGWNLSTPLSMRIMTDGFGVKVHRKMVDRRKSIYLINQEYYNAPYLSVPESIGVTETSPVQCGYVIDHHILPTTLNVIFPMWSRKVGTLPESALGPIIKMTNSPGKVITLPPKV